MSESDTETSTRETPRRQAGEGAATTQKQPRKQPDAPRRSSGSAERQESSRDQSSRSGQPRSREESAEASRRDDGGSGRTSSAGGEHRGDQTERPRRRPEGENGNGGEEGRRRRPQSDDGEDRGDEEQSHRRTPERDRDDRDADDRPRRRHDKDDDKDDDEDDDGRRGRPRLGAGRAARLAVRQLAELTSRTIEGVVGVRRDGECWIVLIEVVEDPRVPSTADIMAEYEVELDGDGELMGYRRRARYARGHTEE